MAQAPHQAPGRRWLLQPAGMRTALRESPALGSSREEAHEEQEGGWADEARGSFREHERRRALVDGNARSCGQDGLVAVATALGVRTSKDAVRAATLPPEGDTSGRVACARRSMSKHVEARCAWLCERECGPAA